MNLACPYCDEDERLRGARAGDVITITCEACGNTWDRDTRPACPSCGTDDVEPVVVAIVEKGRGTQLSVVGNRVIHLCPECDRETLTTYWRNKPNPLMPDELPTVSDAD